MFHVTACISTKYTNDTATLKQITFEYQTLGCWICFIAPGKRKKAEPNDTDIFAVGHKYVGIVLLQRNAHY